MSGLDALSNALANVGVALKSKRDYEQEVGRYNSDMSRNAEELRQSKQRTALGDDQARELERRRTAEAEERATVTDYARRSAPGFNFDQQQPQQAAPAPAPAPAAPDAVAQPDQGASGGPTAPSQADVRASDNAIAAGQPQAPTEQPMPATAIPGPTLSSSPVAAPQAPTPPQEASTTPGGNPSLAAPPRVPASLRAPAAPAPSITGSRIGMLDELAQKALARGDMARYNELQANKNQMQKEGFAQAAHEALVDPDNVRKIESVFNSYGDVRLVPGSLVHESGGKYSGAIINPDGTTRPFQHFDMLHAAMAMGVIAPPTIKNFDASHTVISIGPDGKTTTLAEGHKFATAMNRNGDIVTTNLQTGETKVQGANGTDGRLSSAQAAGVRQIVTLTRAESSQRANQLPGAADNKPSLNLPQAASVAQNIYLNNPDHVQRGGLNPARATEIALAVNDKSPDAVTGTAMRGGELWNVVKYGKGKDAQVYAVSRSAQQPAAQQPAPAAAAAQTPGAAPAAAQAAPVTAPAAPAPAPAAAAPKSLPRPERKPPAAEEKSTEQPQLSSPQVEALGAQVDKLKDSIGEANKRLHALGGRGMRGPEADAIRKEIANLESSHANAKAQYETQLGLRVSGAQPRQLKP